MEKSGIEFLVVLPGGPGGGGPFFPFDTLGLPSLFVFFLMLPGIPSFSPT